MVIHHRPAVRPTDKEDQKEALSGGFWKLEDRIQHYPTSTPYDTGLSRHLLLDNQLDKGKGKIPDNFAGYAFLSRIGFCWLTDRRKQGGLQLRRIQGNERKGIANRGEGMRNARMTRRWIDCRIFET
jgi:hypothetical protein